MELWGGAECTVNRVGATYRDQTVLTGHQDRADDLERFAALGLKALRYPVLWERLSASAPHERDFRWTDERLPEIRRLGMRPIAGLIHHGSGPRWTDLLDDGRFALGLADHAQAVAERYPWLDAYTPVNEPLTTARFSCLYGHWYPHRCDEGAMWRAVLNQVDATRLAMARIRRINSAAQLVQTEDLGHTHSTPALATRAAFDNQRRWITWDLLCGRVDADHALHAQIAAFGLGDRLKAIADEPCPPDVIGVNHYLTSERFLDDKVDAYPEALRPRPGEPPHVDVEAARVSADGVMGIEALLAETWRRYQLPIAVTECHNGCTRDEQIRWVVETWRACERLGREGCDIRAVTAWSLVGAVDWDSLLTRPDDHYEPGVFDNRGRTPRPTALAALYAQLGHGEEPRSIALAAPGWWRRDVRLTLGRCVGSPSAKAARRAPIATSAVRPVLITGATGTLGRAFIRACEQRALPYEATDRRLLPLGQPWRARKVLSTVKPSAVIHTAGWVRVDEAEREVDACLNANAQGAIVLAQACAEAGTPFVTFSSDLVFDGTKASTYLECDAPNPLSVYGRSKALMESGVLATGGRSLVVRTAAFFQEHDPHNFAVQALEALRAGQAFQAASDVRITPTYVPDLVDAVLDLVLDGEVGVWHLVNASSGMSWADFARLIAERNGLDVNRVHPVLGAHLGWSAPRPLNGALDSSRGRLLPTLDDAVARFLGGTRDKLDAMEERREQERRSTLAAGPSPALSHPNPHRATSREAVMLED